MAGKPGWASALSVGVHRLALMGCKTAPWPKQVWLPLVSFASQCFQCQPSYPQIQPGSGWVCQGPVLPTRHHREVALFSFPPPLHIKTIKQTKATSSSLSKGKGGSRAPDPSCEGCIVPSCGCSTTAGRPQQGPNVWWPSPQHIHIHVFVYTHLLLFHRNIHTHI